MPRFTLKKLEEWKADFAANIRRDPTACKTWREIQQAGIVRETVFLLFFYTKGHFAVEEFASGNRRVIKDSRTAQRAIRKAKDKQGDPREAMFVERAKMKSILVANADWINPSSSYRTVADAVVAMGNPTPDLMAKRGEAVRRSDTMTVLRTLKLYADKHGVRLGLKRLVALTDCTHANRGLLEGKHLSRFFNRSDVKMTDRELLDDFERHLLKLNLEHFQF